MANYGRDDRSSGGGGGYRGGSSRGGFSRGGFGGNRGRSSFAGGDREMFEAVCDNCGNKCQVPFHPTMGKPVYCSDCFEKMGGRDGNRNAERPEMAQVRQSAPQNSAQMDNIASKLDKIISLLEAQSAPIAKVEVKKVVKKAKVI